MSVLLRSQELVRPMSSDLRSVRRRVWIIGGVLLLGLLGLGYRAYDVGVSRHDHFATQGNRQQLRTYTVAGSRGDIVDRSYVPLAVTDRVQRIVLNPRLIRAQGHGEAVVAAVLALFPEADPSKIRDALSKDKAYRKLRHLLNDEQAKTLMAQRLPGVRLEPQPNRVYPRQLLAAQVLGRVGAEGHGNLGIEYGMDELLTGRDAASPAYFARGKKLLVDGFPDPQVSRGHTVVLTVDSAIQAMAEEEIDTLITN